MSEPSEPKPTESGADSSGLVFQTAVEKMFGEQMSPARQKVMATKRTLDELIDRFALECGQMEDIRQRQQRNDPNLSTEAIYAQAAVVRSTEAEVSEALTRYVGNRVGLYREEGLL